MRYTIAAMASKLVSRDYFRLLYDYSCWARDRLLAAARAVDEADYLRPGGLDHGSLHGTLVHALSAEIIWRNRWQGVSPKSVLAEGEVAGIEALDRLWQLEEAKMRAFLDGLTDETLMADVPLHKHRRRTGLRAPVATHGARHQSRDASQVGGRSGHDQPRPLAWRPRPHHLPAGPSKLNFQPASLGSSIGP
jgi:uncharacterized damage-inducible protein DinB